MENDWLMISCDKNDTVIAMTWAPKTKRKTQNYTEEERGGEV